MVRCGSKQPYEPLSVCTIFIRKKQIKKMMIVLEGIAAAFVVLVCLVAGIADGAHNMAFFYEKDVQNRVEELGLITKTKIQEKAKKFFLFGILPYFVIVISFVYAVNKARGFWDPFWQMSAILLIEGIFDRLFIDWYWVNHTKAWEIPGTEDLKPYINKKAWITKWLGTLIGFPLIVAIISSIMSLIIK